VKFFYLFIFYILINIKICENSKRVRVLANIFPTSFVICVVSTRNYRSKDLCSLSLATISNKKYEGIHLNFKVTMEFLRNFLLVFVWTLWYYEQREREREKERERRGGSSNYYILNHFYLFKNLGSQYRLI